MRYAGPRCRLCRREGKKLSLKGERCNTLKCAFVRKPDVPGKYGKNVLGKKTEYHSQLRAKQAAKRIYSLNEKQLRSYYQEATRQEGNTNENLLKLLEMRLDNAVYRAGLTSSRSQARQIVSHSLVRLNDKRAKVASITLKPGDKIEIKRSAIDSPLFAGIAKKKDDSPTWLKVDLSKLSFEVVGAPEVEESEKIDTQTIVEFYSR